MKAVDEKELRAVELLMSGECDRGQLALSLSVSRMTAGRIADRLLESGMVMERETRKGRGRPSKLLCLTTAWRYWILRLDKGRCEALWVRPNGEILFRITQPYDVGVGIGDPFAELYSRLLFASSFSRETEQPQAIALLVGDTAGQISLSSEQIDLILSDKGESTEEICRLLNRTILQKMNAKE
ncbi:MAG: hypothetical protein IKA76_00105 [Clostridia bacterium]|nr:hypothetical protein [Clostridia bacterium]